MSNPKGLDVIKAKRLDGPRAGEVHSFLRINFDRIASNKQFGVWEVVEDKASTPKASKKAESKSEDKSE